MCKKKYNLKISGAMCMPPAEKNPKKYFENMRTFVKRRILKILAWE